MIKYSLKCKSINCKDKNFFDGWFQNIKMYENQKQNGLVLCPFCGSDNIIKSLTAPSFRLNKINSPTIEIEQKDESAKISRKSIISEVNKINISILLRAVKKEIEKTSEFVGDNFVKEVRSMKSGEVEERSIYGNGSNKEIEELKDEGIDVLKIPWVSEDH